MASWSPAPASIDDLRFARQVLPPADLPRAGPPRSRRAGSIYLNKNGVTLPPGDNDARTNRSTIATQQTTIPAWNVEPDDLGDAPSRACASCSRPST